MGGKHLTERQRERVLVLKSRGESMAEIARQVGKSYTCIFNFFHREERKRAQAQNSTARRGEPNADQRSGGGGGGSGGPHLTRRPAQAAAARPPKTVTGTVYLPMQPFQFRLDQHSLWLQQESPKACWICDLERLGEATPPEIAVVLRSYLEECLLSSTAYPKRKRDFSKWLEFDVGESELVLNVIIRGPVSLGKLQYQIQMSPVDLEEDEDDEEEEDEVQEEEDGDDEDPNEPRVSDDTERDLEEPPSDSQHDDSSEHKRCRDNTDLNAAASRTQARGSEDSPQMEPEEEEESEQQVYMRLVTDRNVWKVEQTCGSIGEHFDLDDQTITILRKGYYQLSLKLPDRSAAFPLKSKPVVFQNQIAVASFAGSNKACKISEMIWLDQNDVLSVGLLRDAQVCPPCQLSLLVVQTK